MPILFFFIMMASSFGQQAASKADVQALVNKIDKLEAKIEEGSSTALWGGLATVSVALLTMIIGIYQYASKKDEDFKKVIWEERKKLYMELLDYTSKIAIAGDFNSEDCVANRKEFWSMYWGRLCVMEDKEVLAAIINYGDKLEQVEQVKVDLEHSDLENLSYLLAEACRNSLIKTWQPVKFENLGHLPYRSTKNEKIIDSEAEEKKS